MAANYYQIDFLDKSNGISIRKQIIKVTKHLGFGFSNYKFDRRIKIYSIFGHREVMPHAIKTSDDAIQFCNYLESVYGDFWSIHEIPDYQDFDIIQVAQHSVDEGIRTFVALKSLEDRDTITFSEFRKEMENI